MGRRAQLTGLVDAEPAPRKVSLQRVTGSVRKPRASVVGGMIGASELSEVALSEVNEGLDGPPTPDALQGLSVGVGEGRGGHSSASGFAGS